MTTDPTEMTEEEMMQTVAFMRSEYMRQALVKNYNARVERIQQIRTPPYNNRKYAEMPREKRAAIAAECEDTWGFYCVSSYTTSLHEVMEMYGYDKDNGLFLKDGDNGAAYNTARAIDYVQKNYPDAGMSLDEFPPGTTLGQALKILNERGKLPEGSMIMVRSEGNTVSGRHCVMFMGIDKETGQPLFSSNNPERIMDPCESRGWADQVVEPGKNSPYIINTQQIIAEKQMEMERQAMQEMGPARYYAEHQAEFQAYHAYALEHGLISPEPRRIDRIDAPEEFIAIPEREQITVPTSMEGSFWENLYGVLHYRRFHPRETEQVVETQEPPVANSPEQIVTSKLSDAYQQLESQQPPSPDPRPGAAQMLQQVGNGLVDNEQKGLTASTSTHTNDTSTKSKTSTQTQSYAPVKDGGR